MNSIQQIVSSGKTNIDVPMGEYEGPLRIGQSCIIDGHGATIWAKGEAALIVEASQVIIKNLRVEITDKPEQVVAIKIKSDTVLKDVEVYGQEEINGAVSRWKLPRLLDFGNFAADRGNVFCREITVERYCTIVNNVHGLEIKPMSISQGINEVFFKVAALMNSTVLYGDIVLQTDYGVNKRIYVSGRAMQGAKEVYEQKATHASGMGASVHNAGGNIREKGNSRSSAKMVVKGQRIGLAGAKELLAVFQGKCNGVDVDPYAFLLYENGKTRQDSDLVFFGNMQSESDGVYIDNVEGQQGLGICLANVPSDVKSVVIAFAVYEDEGSTNKNFSRVENPLVRIMVDSKDSYDFPMDVGLERVVNALEVYRHKGEWKVKAVGAGFMAGLKRLCEQYGIAVE